MNTAAPPTLRILSANLCGGRVDGRLFVEMLVHLGVDVVTMQELNPDTADAVARVLPFGHLAPAAGSTGMGIAIRWEGVVRIVPLPTCDAQSATLDSVHWPALEQRFEVMNVHFSNPVRQPSRHAWSERTTQREAVGAWLEESQGPRVVVGDFNASPVWPVYRRLSRYGDDLMLRAARRSGERVERTWGPLWSGRRRLLRIDHAFGTGVCVQSASVVYVAGSDHSAIMLDVAPDHSIAETTAN